MWAVSTALLAVLATPGPGLTAAGPCDLPFEAGPCKAAKSVIAFEAGKCVPKIYGGCRGNANRFSSVAECEAACSAAITARFQPVTSFSVFSGGLNLDNAITQKLTR